MWGIAACLNNLGNVAYMQGDYAGAFALQAEGLTIKSRLQDKFSIALTLESIADLAVEENDPERAMRLLGAEERLRKELEAPRTPDPQTRGSRLLAKAIQTWSAERLARARAEGYAMTLEAAIAYALRSAETL